MNGADAPLTASGGRPAEKALQTMFSGVPRRYDLLNRTLTFGLDQRWRRRAAAACLERAPERVLDLCTGTGDLALLLARAAAPGTAVVAADFCEPMLEIARDKARTAGLDRRIEFRFADAAALPFEDGSFGAVGIAFGFRNLVWKNPARDRHLAEIARVVAPGGRFVVVETSRPRSRILRAGSDAWFAVAVGPLGGVISRRAAAYRYLSVSARHFHTSDEVSSMLLGAGFRSVAARPLLGGVAAIHVAERGEERR